MKKDQGVILAKNAKSNFGPRGWFIVIFGMLMYFCSAAVSVEGTNLIVPTFSQLHGVDSAGLYSLGTVAGLCGIPISVLIGVCMTKFGPRKAVGASWIVGAAGLLILSFSGGYAGYCIGRILLNVGSIGGITIGMNGLITNWFPTKKDLIQGYATIGSNLSTALSLFVMSLLLGGLGLGGTFRVWAGVYLAVGVVALVFLKDNPEDVGCFPDNDRGMTQEKVQELHRIGEEYKKTSPWTAGKLLKTKQTWQIAIGYGIILLITVGVLSTFVTTLILKGTSQTFAISMMTVAAVCAIPCSYLWGVLAAKMGTKTATLILYGVVLACIVFMLLPGTWTVYVAVPLLGCFIGAGNNLTPSIIGSVYGRYDFSKALTVIIPIWNVVVSFATMVVGVPQALTGSYVAAYITLAVFVVIGFVLVLTLDDRCIGRKDLVD